MGRKTGPASGRVSGWLVNISVFFFNRVLQVIQDDALTFGSQQTRGFVVTFRSFLKGDDDKYVVNFRCK